MFTRNGTLQWEFHAGGAIISSVVVDSDGNLYFGCLDYHMYSITPDGKKRWKRYLGHQVWSSPLLTEQMLLIATKNEENDTRTNAFALAMETGEFVWRANVLGGVIATPRLNLAKSSVYFCSLIGNIVGLSIMDGEVTFKASFNDSGELWATPAVGGDGVMYIFFGSGRLIALNPSAATTVWEKDLQKCKASNSCLLTCLQVF